MKLLTLNCHSWHEENQLNKICYLAETIKEMMYDVIALQEVSQLLCSQQVKYSHFYCQNKLLDKLSNSWEL